MLSFILSSPESQEALGAVMAGACRGGCVIYLEGELGAGKTTLARGFLRGLGYGGPVKSPTYTLVEPYELAHRRCYHFDLYRLGDPAELEYLGMRDLLQGDAVLLVEWPERGEGELPPPDLMVRIQHQHNARRISLEARTERGEGVMQGVVAWRQ